MEARVAALEADMKDVKASQHRTETSLARIEAQLAAVLPTLATKADLATTNGRIDALDAKVNGLDTRLATVERTVSGKLPSWWQMIAIFGALLALAYGFTNLSAGRLPWQAPAGSAVTSPAR